MEMGYYMAVGMGLIPTQIRTNALGHNPSIANGGAADVWEGGGDYNWLPSAATLQVSSTSANDAAAGTGGRTVTVIGLDANYLQIQETLTLNGVTPVLTTKQYLRVNTFVLSTSGSSSKNAGDITLQVSGGGSIVNIMRVGYGFGRCCVYTVPANCTLFIKSAVFTILAPSNATNNTAVFGFFTRLVDGTNRIPLEFQVTSVVPYRHDIDTGLIITQKQDFCLRVTNTAQAATNVTAAFEGVLVVNSALL
jgi:hypothetical protein